MAETISAGLDAFVEILGVRDAGNLAEERLLLKCKQVTSIGNILVLAGKLAGDTSVTPGRDHVCWLPDGDVGAGEYIRLYSKAGVNQKTTGKYGEESVVFHNFYWGKTAPVWVENDAVVVMTLQEWKLHKVRN